MMGGDAMYNSEFVAIAGAGAEGTLVTFGPDATKSPSAAGLVTRLKEQNISADGFTLYSYAAVQVAAQAIAKAGTVDPEAVAKVMHSGTEFDSVIGPISYDEKGDIKRVDFILYEIKDGKFVEALSQ
jgi:branched-chain amino acid transport system substrate-binding protein